MHESGPPRHDASASMLAATRPTHVTVVAHDVGAAGGMERQVADLIAGLLERGHEITLIARSSELSPHVSLTFHRVHVPSRPFVITYPLFTLMASVIVWRKKRGLLHTTGAVVLNRVDVITVHLCHRAIARIPGLIRSSRQRPLWKLHGRVAAALARAGEFWAYRPSRVRCIVAVSSGGLEELKEEYPRLADRAIVIPNGVRAEIHATDTVMPRDSRRGAADADPSWVDDRLPVALFVGSEWEGKGLRYAIEALVSAPDWALVVVGDGDRQRYESLAERLGVRDRVSFTGWRRDLDSIYPRAAAFVLPSSYETFSLAAYEAAASGLALLCTRVRGVSDLVEDGATGWYVRQDGREIGRRLNELADPKLRGEMGEAARSAAQRFSVEAMVDKYAALYRRIAD